MQRRVSVQFKLRHKSVREIRAALVEATAKGAPDGAAVEFDYNISGEYAGQTLRLTWNEEW